MHRPILATLAATSLAAAVGCATPDEEVGTIDVSLTGRSPSGTEYILRNAEITVSGPSGVLLFRTENDPYTQHLTGVVAPGAYTLSLADGWFLERFDDGAQVDAVLLSTNPSTFQVTAAEITSLTLHFAIDGGDVVMGNGEFDVGLDVADTLSWIGHREPLGYVDLLVDYLTAVPLDVPADSTLFSLAQYSWDEGIPYQLALYRDVSGVPAELVAQTAVRPTVIGANQVSIAPVALSAGRYWLAAIYQTQPAAGGEYNPNTIVKAAVHYFGEPLPAVFPEFHDTFSGYRLNHYMAVTTP